MKLERDSIPLDKEFPFQISEVELNQANSRPGTWHWHSYFEITWVLEGKGNYFVNGQEYTMEKDDIIIFNNVEPHGWKLLGGNMKLLVMIFSPEFVAEKISLFDAEYLKPFVERGSNFKNRVGREEKVNEEIRISIREIYQEWNERKEGYPLMIKANVLRILTKLYRNYKPMAFFGLVAAVLLILGIGFFIPVFVTFLETGRVGKIPTLIVCGFAVLGAIQSLFSGLVLQTMVQKNRQDFEMELQRIQEQYNKLQ